MKITLFNRKPFDSQFSIENVFQALLPYLKADNLIIYYELPSPSKKVINRFIAALAARKNQSDINHITGDIYFIGPFLNGLKTIITVHDCDFVLRSKGIKRQLLYFFWLYLPLRHAKSITTISSATKKDLLQLLNIPEEKVRIIPNPLTLVKDIPKRERKQNRIPIILQIGTKRNKNLETLIPAIAGLDIQLNIIGKLNTTQLELLQQYSINYKSESNLTVPELISNYQQADVLAFISTREGFGLPIIEANALSCPVITSNCSSMPEVAGDAAILVNPLDKEEIRSKIIQLLKNKTLQEELIQKGYQNVQRFRPEMIAQQYLNLYKEIHFQPS